MSNLIVNNISDRLSFQEDTGIISYRTVGFLCRGVTNPTGGTLRNLIWETPSTATRTYIRSWSLSSGIFTADSGSGMAGNYLINFNIFVTGSSNCTVLVDGVTRFFAHELVAGYTNLRGSFIASISASSTIRISTSATVLSGSSAYSMISAFKIT
jgi:hypothetical protein